MPEAVGAPNFAQVTILALGLCGLAAFWFRATWVYMELSHSESWFVILAMPVLALAGLCFVVARRMVRAAADAKGAATLATLAVFSCYLLMWAHLLWSALPLLPGVAGVPGSRTRSPTERLAVAAVLAVIGFALAWAISRRISAALRPNAVPTRIGLGIGLGLFALSVAGGRLVDAGRLGIELRRARVGQDSSSRIEALERLTEQSDVRVVPLLKELSLRPVAPLRSSTGIVPERRSERGDSFGAAFEERVAAITLLANFPEGLDTLVEIAADDPVPDARASATFVLVHFADDPRVQELLRDSLLTDADAKVRYAGVRIAGAQEAELRDELLRALLADPDSTVRLRAAEELTLSGGNAGYEVAFAIAADEGSPQRARAIRILGQIGDPRAAALVCSLVDDPNVGYVARDALAVLATRRSEPGSRTECNGGRIRGGPP